MHPRRRFSTIVLATVCTFFITSMANAQQAVMVGGEADYDACGGYGVVKGLNPNGDGFLAVRSGPGSKNAMRDKIHNGQAIWFCDQKGPWVGIVYSQKPNADCKVGSPIARRSPYRGPCRSGWVHQKYVEMTAG